MKQKYVMYAVVVLALVLVFGLHEKLGISASASV